MSDRIDDLKNILNEKEASPEEKRQKWSGFIESTVVNFFDLNNLEKLFIEDGNGNKAKLVRTKDNGIRTEYSSVVIL